jgi:hypothetical protein
MPSKTITSDLTIFQAPRSSILCDGSLLNNVIDEFGIDVVIRRTTKTEDATEAYDNFVETTTDYRTVAFINVYSEDDDEVKEGIFQGGQVILNFKNTDEAWVKPGYDVWVDNKWWQIDRINVNYSGTARFFIQATLNRH